MKLVNWTKGSDYSVSLVKSPAKEKGTVFLKRKAEVWNYIPSIERNIKLPPSMMMQGWMGTDLTNDDMVKQSSIVVDYSHNIIGSEIIESFAMAITNSETDSESYHCDSLLLIIESSLLIPEGISSQFFSYLMRAYDAQKVFYSMGGGLRQSLNYSDLRRMPIPAPSEKEQQAIVDFLDVETQRIDRLIERKRRFIDLLSEHIAATIIDLVGPREGWQSFPFWSFARAKSISGKVDEGLLSVYLDRGVIPYSEGGGLVHKPAESLEKYQLVEPGDLVMNNQQAWRGSLGVSNHRGIVSPAYLIFELDRTRIDPAFANYAFRSRPYVDQFMLASMSVGDIQRQIKWPHLRRVMVSLPPLSEQKQIVEELDRRLCRLEGLIARTRMSVTYLQEKRTALITAAVTGKIDVRNAA